MVGQATQTKRYSTHFCGVCSSSKQRSRAASVPSGTAAAYFCLALVLRRTHHNYKRTSNATLRSSSARGLQQSRLKHKWTAVVDKFVCLFRRSRWSKWHCFIGQSSSDQSRGTSPAQEVGISIEHIKCKYCRLRKLESNMGSRSPSCTQDA
jgi:hypothetical protein